MKSLADTDSRWTSAGVLLLSSLLCCGKSPGQEVSAQAGASPASSAAWMTYVGQLGDELQNEAAQCGPVVAHPVIAFATLAAVAGGIAGLAAGGSVNSGLKGAAVGGALGGYAARREQKKNLATSAQAAGKAICREISGMYNRLTGNLNDLLHEQGAGCGITDADIRSNPAGALQLLISGCGVAATNTGWSGIYAVFSGIAADNIHTCATIRPLANRVHAHELIPPSCELVAPAAPVSTILLLARMSAAAYEHDAKQIDLNNLGGYRIESFSTRYPSGFGATVFANGSIIVIAYRGTDIAKPSSEDLAKDILTTAMNLETDSGWMVGEAVPLVAAYITLGANELALVRARHPNALIILTGHSLGGAIAQAVGYMANVEAVAFDAPGMVEALAKIEAGDEKAVTPMNFGAQLLAARKALGTLDQVGPSRPMPSFNFRLLGDQVSRAGTPIGSICTVYREYQGGIKLTNGNWWQSNWLNSHSLDALITQLEVSAPMAPDFVDQPAMIGPGTAAVFPQGKSCDMP